MYENEYVEKLEKIVKNMLNSFNNIPFDLVVKTISEKQVEKFDCNNSNHKSVLAALIKAGELTLDMIEKTGIDSKRPNEAGNAIEKFVKNSLKKLDIKVDTPITKSGKRQSSGYPDIEFEFQNKHYYLECKTYNIENIYSTQRSFYMSPSDNPKIVYDTVHFLISFELFKKDDNKFYAKSFKIVSLNSLDLNVKFEFNSTNKKMYSNDYGAQLLYES